MSAHLVGSGLTDDCILGALIILMNVNDMVQCADLTSNLVMNSANILKNSAVLSFLGLSPK